MTNPIDLPSRSEEIAEYEDSTNRPRLSLTSDVLDFRKCHRKYGMYKVRGFSGSSPTAEFVGTFAHRAMEEAWQQYQESHNPPTKEEMVSILEQLRQDLLDEGRSPHSWPAVLHAGYQVLCMTATMDELGLFESVVDSERTLRRGEQDFVLEGVVDLILNETEGQVLWDFKSAQDPRRSLGDPDATTRSRRASQQRLNDYSLQLRLYHYLCEAVLDEVPARCELIFLGEFGRADIKFSRFDSLEAAWNATSPDPLSDAEWNSQREGATGTENYGLFYSVSNSESEITDAIAEFEDTAQDILRCRDIDEWSAPAESELPSKQTCDDCDFLESCETAMRVRANEE